MSVTDSKHRLKACWSADFHPAPRVTAAKGDFFLLGTATFQPPLLGAAFCFMQPWDELSVCQVVGWVFFLCFVLPPRPRSLLHKHAGVKWTPVQTGECRRRESGRCWVSCEDFNFFKVLFFFFFPNFKPSSAEQGKMHLVT